ncbi:hypothetical protein D3C81_2276570 [compost metagenome]
MAPLTTREVAGFSKAAMRPTWMAVPVRSSEVSLNRFCSSLPLAKARMTRTPVRFSLSTVPIRSSLPW